MIYFLQSSIVLHFLRSSKYVGIIDRNDKLHVLRHSYYKLFIFVWFIEGDGC